MLLPRTFLDIISLVKIHTVLLLTIFDVIMIAGKSPLFSRIFFDKILMGKNLTSFLLSCKLVSFPSLATLKS